MVFVPGESNRSVDCPKTPVIMGFTHRPARKNAGMITRLPRRISFVSRKVPLIVIWVYAVSLMAYFMRISELQKFIRNDNEHRSFVEQIDPVTFLDIFIALVHFQRDLRRYMLKQKCSNLNI